MRRKKVKAPLSPEELEKVLTVYNTYVREWNTREGDLSREPPSKSRCSGAHSGAGRRMANRNVTIVVKDNPDRRITIGVARMTCYQPGNGLKNEIPLENVRIAYSESFSPSRNMNANKSRL